MSQRINYYQTIHKALRRLLFLFSIDLGALDTRDASAVAILGERFEKLKAYLHLHAHHEDTHFQPFIAHHLPELAKSIEQEHQVHEIMLDKLSSAFKALTTLTSDNEKLAAAYALYLQVNQFITSYLQHLDHEELIIMPKLWEVCHDETLHEPLGNLIKSMSPEDYFTSLDVFWPAINAQEKKMMIGVP